MTGFVEHLATVHSGLGVTPHYRCECGLLHRTPGEAHGCRHRLHPVPLTPDPSVPSATPTPAQPTLEVTDA